MGCDIHIVLERRFDGRWIGLTELSYLPGYALRGTTYGQKTREYEPVDYLSYRIKERDYNFFYQLAGVRHGDEPAGAALGMPNDASELSGAVIGLDQDLHSHSWIMLRDLVPILIRAKKLTADVAARHLLTGEEQTIRVLHEWVNDNVDEETLDEYRLVFAFDN